MRWIEVEHLAMERLRLLRLPELGVDRRESAIELDERGLRKRRRVCGEDRLVRRRRGVELLAAVERIGALELDTGRGIDRDRAIEQLHRRRQLRKLDRAARGLEVDLALLRR